MLLLNLLLIQKLHRGNLMKREKEVITAYGMVLSVIGRLDMSLAFTLAAVVSMVQSIPAEPSSVLFISRFFTFPTMMLISLRSHMQLTNFQGLEVSASGILDSLDLSGNTDSWGTPVLQLQKPSFTDLVQNLTRFKNVYPSVVDMSSTIPQALGANSYSLTHLFLDECGLHGESPLNIFQLPSLQFLSVSFNPDLTGYLPEFQETP